MSHPTISVIVVNWNGKHHLSICLSSLLNQTCKPDELILVDNGSSDGSASFVKQHFPTVRVIELDQNLGYCGGNNIGIKKSFGDCVALINNDTEAHHCWLEEAIKVLDETPEASFVASRICLFDRRDMIDTVGDEFFSSGYPGKRGWLDSFGPRYGKREWVFGASGGAVVYQRKMLDDIGLFDEDYVSFQEDVDLSFRGLLRGYRCIYAPDAVVYHKVGATSAVNSPNRQYLSHRNHWFTLIKDLPNALWFKFLVDILFAELLIAFSNIKQGRLGVFLRARWDVVRNIRGLLHKRRAIQRAIAIPEDEILKMIRRDWIAVRREEKKRELVSWKVSQG